jgi:hypothetical protein
LRRCGKPVAPNLKRVVHSVLSNRRHRKCHPGNGALVPEEEGMPR